MADALTIRAAAPERVAAIGPAAATAARGVVAPTGAIAAGTDSGSVVVLSVAGQLLSSLSVFRSRLESLPSATDTPTANALQQALTALQVSSRQLSEAAPGSSELLAAVLASRNPSTAAPGGDAVLAALLTTGADPLAVAPGATALTADILAAPAGLAASTQTSPAETTRSLIEQAGTLESELFDALALPAAPTLANRPALSASLPVSELAPAVNTEFGSAVDALSPPPTATPPAAPAVSPAVATPATSAAADASATSAASAAPAPSDATGAPSNPAEPVAPGVPGTPAGPASTVAPVIAADAAPDAADLLITPLTSVAPAAAPAPPAGTPPSVVPVARGPAFTTLATLPAVSTTPAAPAAPVSVAVSPAATDAAAAGRVAAARMAEQTVPAVDPFRRALRLQFDPAYAAVIAATHLNDFDARRPVTDARALASDSIAPVTALVRDRAIADYREAAAGEPARPVRGSRTASTGTANRFWT